MALRVKAEGDGLGGDPILVQPLLTSDWGWTAGVSVTKGAAREELGFLVPVPF